MADTTQQNKSATSDIGTGIGDILNPILGGTTTTSTTSKPSASSSTNTIIVVVLILVAVGIAAFALIKSKKS